jgi:hypothetical protein
MARYDLKRFSLAPRLSPCRRDDHRRNAYVTGCRPTAEALLNGMLLLQGKSAARLGSKADRNTRAPNEPTGWRFYRTGTNQPSGCHRRPHLAAFDLAADRDAVAFGLTNGASCVGSCWALMLTLVVSQSHVLGMVAVTLFALGERLEGPAPLARCWRGPSKLCASPQRRPARAEAINFSRPASDPATS